MSFTDIIASTISTVFAEIITIPICTVKTNYQTNLNYKSIINVTNDIYKAHGIYGFYNSSMSAMTSQIVSTSTKFTAYNYIKEKRHTEQKDIKNNILNGSLSGIISSVFTHPLDVIKVHNQNQLSIMNEIKTHKMSIFYRGYSKSLFKNIALTSLIFPFYDFYKYHFNNSIISAGLSAITASIFLHPIDYLKIRHISNQSLYINYTGLLNFTKYYYRGLHINLMRIIPHFVITMVITEKIKEKLNNKERYRQD